MAMQRHNQKMFKAAVHPFKSCFMISVCKFKLGRLLLAKFADFLGLAG
jgi:hypothetical protein